MTHVKVTIGTKHYDVPTPIKLGLLRRIDPLFGQIRDLDKNDPDITTKHYAIGEQIVVTVLSSVDSSFSAKDLDEAPMFASDFTEAIKQIGKAAGLFKDPEPGEATGQKPPNPESA